MSQSFLDTWNGSTTEENTVYGSDIEVLRCDDTHILVVFLSDSSFVDFGTDLIRYTLENTSIKPDNVSVNFNTKDNVRYTMVEFNNIEMANKYAKFLQVFYKAKCEIIANR